MNRVYIMRHGSPDVLQLQREQAPVPRPGEIRIRVEATGISHVDLLATKGRHPRRPSLPFAPGHEVAGEVDAVAPGAGHFAEGDAVLALAPSGGYGSSVCVPYQTVWKRPENMPAEHGAALPVDFLSAYLVLVVMGSVRTGTRVLVHDVASSAGLAALAVCGILGGEVMGTAPEALHPAILARDVRHVVDADKHDYELAFRELLDGAGVDLIMDGRGGSRWRKDYRLLAPSGRVVYTGYRTGMERGGLLRQVLRRLIYLPRYDPELLATDSRGVLGFDLFSVMEQTHLLREAMRDLLDWYERGWLRPEVGETLPLAEAAKAHHRLLAEPFQRKLILVP